MLLLKEMQNAFEQQNQKSDEICNKLLDLENNMQSLNQISADVKNIDSLVPLLARQLTVILEELNEFKKSLETVQQEQLRLEELFDNMYRDMKGIGDKLWRNDWEPNQNIRRRIFEYAGMDTAEYVIEHMRKIPAFNKPLDILSYAINAVSIEGLYLEFGVYSGTTINKIASEVPDKTVYGFDSFEGLPETWRTNFEEGRFKMEELPKVNSNVTLVKGLFNDTLPEFAMRHPDPCAFIHVDCDLYSSTKTIFEYLKFQIVSGTVIVFDEYFNYPGWRYEEYKAFQEFITENDLKYEYLAYVEVLEQVAVKIL